MKIGKVLGIISVLAFGINIGMGQNNDLKFHLIPGLNGKPLGKIRNITQDPHGYMWFSGEGAHCIYKYDGRNLTDFRHEEGNVNSLGGYSINSVYADDEGIIWVGHEHGLDQLDPATGVFKHFIHDPNDPSSLSGAANPVLKDRQARLWVGTDGGLDMLDQRTGKFIHYRHDPNDPKSLSSNFIWNLYEDRQGVIWIATAYPFDASGTIINDPEEGGLNRLEPDGTFTRFKHDPKDPHSLINNKVRAMFEDSRGVFWVGTSGDGLHTMDRKTGQFERHTYDPSNPDKLSRPPLKTSDDYAYKNDQITYIIEDVMGSIWIGTMWSGINRYDIATKKIIHYQASNGFPDESGWNAFQSKDGALWISTQQDNLYRFDPFLGKLNSIPTPFTPWSFIEDHKYLWVGTGGGGLLKYDQKGGLMDQFRYNASDSHSLFDADNIILSMFHERGDTIWIGTSDGPGIFNKETEQFSRLPIQLKYEADTARNVPDIMQDGQSMLWFVLNGHGLLRYNPNDHTFKQYRQNTSDNTSLSSNNIVSIFEDSTGVIWVCDLLGGVNQLDRTTDQFRHYLPGTPCHNMFEDSSGLFWLSANAGPYNYNRKVDSFIPFFESESPARRLNIIALLEDNDKNLWGHNTSEIIKFNKATKEINIYADNYGIQENSIIPLGIYKNSKGQILLNHQNGFFAFYPEELVVNDEPLKIIITDLFINTLPVRSGNESILKRPIEEIDELDLAFNQNNIALNFAAIDYRSPETIKYYTMLDGYDDTWREAKVENQTHYFNLPLGKFDFKIKAYNKDGTMGVKILTINIHPPWWLTGQAYAGYLFLFVMIVWGFSKFRTRSLQRQNLLLEVKVNQRTDALNKSLVELKETQTQLIQSEKMASLGELTAGIAHEIQNPLNFVNNFSEVSNELIEEMTEEMEKGDILEAKAIADDVKQNLEKILHHGKRADAIVKGMLQHSRSSSGVKEPTDINALCDEYLRLAYHGLRAKDNTFNATMETDFDDSIGKINIVPQDMGRVILNLITNAFYAVNERSSFANSSNEASAKLGASEDLKYEPTVTMTTKKTVDKIAISVKDNGNGIPSIVKDKIFQPFFTTKPTGQGTGLGLSMSYDIVKAHGGEIKVETQENEGTTFIIQIPIT